MLTFNEQCENEVKKDGPELEFKNAEQSEGGLSSPQTSPQTTPQTTLTTPFNMKYTICICIPRVSLETTQYDVWKTFEYLLGSSSYIHSVKIAHSHSSPHFKKVFIELYSFPETTIGIRIRNMIEQNKTIKIAYHPFMFWKCVKGRTHTSI
jgi:hypothetical protein